MLVLLCLLYVVLLFRMLVKYKRAALLGGGAQHSPGRPPRPRRHMSGAAPGLEARPTPSAADSRKAAQARKTPQNLRSNQEGGGVLQTPPSNAPIVGGVLCLLICGPSRPGTRSKHIGCASGACPTAVAHTSTFIWRLSEGSGEGSVGGREKGWGALRGTQCGRSTDAVDGANL